MLSAEDLIVACGRLLESNALVSFHDAHRFVRAAKRLGEPRSAVVLAFVALHDENATDGAKRILSDYLRAAQERLSEQHALGARTLLLRDSGKVARAAPGADIEVELEERRAAGMRWDIHELAGDATIERTPNRDEKAPRARFTLTLGRLGAIKLVLSENPPNVVHNTKAYSQTPRFTRRYFELVVIVDA